MSLTLIICGGRGYKDRSKVFSALDAIHAKRGISRIIHGDASGVDGLAGDWAAANMVPVTACPAKWRANGKAAGPIRNRYMLTLKPDGVVAFPGGDGTADMVAQAEKAGLVVMKIEA